MKKITILSALTLCAPLIGAQQWTYQGGQQTNNGSVTVKSVNGATSQAATQNPTGAAAKVNQTAVTQPPTVVMQATARLPVVAENSACDTAYDRLALNADRTKTLSCQSGQWKPESASSCSSGYVWTGGSCQAISSFASGVPSGYSVMSWTASCPSGYYLSNGGAITTNNGNTHWVCFKN